MKKVLFLMVAVALAGGCLAQGESKKVLFIGNSYTYVNNLPQMVQQMAESNGMQMNFEQVTPGGATFSQQCSSTGAMDMIGQGGWDAVVLQAQSQEPSFPWSQFTAETYPYACQLADAIYEKNDCAEVVFYMTWGRKNGDAQNGQVFDSLATYAGMDDLLCARYTYMAQQNNASVSPVGKVWRKLRADHPEIELYQSDESHPSLEGSYAAACSFYTILFRKNPMDIATDLSVDASIAQTIRETTKAVVYDSLWKYSCHTFLASQPTADSSEWQFSCLSATEPEVCRWDFGDGSSSTELNVTHSYSAAGTYMVQLIAGKSCHPDTNKVEIVIGQSGDEPLGIETVDNNKAVSIYPNPAAESIVVSSSEPVVLKIVDMKGRVVKQTALSGNQKLSVAELPEGVYVAITADGSGLKIQSQKLIIKHR